MQTVMVNSIIVVVIIFMIMIVIIKLHPTHSMSVLSWGHKRRGLRPNVGDRPYCGPQPSAQIDLHGIFSPPTPISFS